MEKKNKTEVKKPQPEKVNPQDPTMAEQIDKKMQDDIREKKFGVTYTWYIFLLACFCLVLGAAITWICQSKANGNGWIATLVCNLLGLIAICLYGYFEMKQIWPHHFHVRKKWYSCIFAGCIIYLISIIASCLIVFVPTLQFATVLANFVVLVVLTLISAGLCRYGRFKLDKEMYCRTHGVELKKQMEYEKTRSKERQAADKMTDEEFKKYRDKIDDTDDHALVGKQATSGIGDEKFDSK